MANKENVKILYDILEPDYDMDEIGGLEGFEEWMKDDDNRRKAQEAMGKKYEMDMDFDQFTDILGYGKKPSLAGVFAKPDAARGVPERNVNVYDQDRQGHALYQTAGQAQYAAPQQQAFQPHTVAQPQQKQNYVEQASQNPQSYYEQAMNPERPAYMNSDEAWQQQQQRQQQMNEQGAYDNEFNAFYEQNAKPVLDEINDKQRQKWAQEYRERARHGDPYAGYSSNEKRDVAPDVAVREVSNAVADKMTDFVLMRMGVDPAALNATEAESNPMSQEEIAAFDQKYGEEYERLASALQQKIYDEYVKKGMPRNTIEYVVGSMFHNSLIGTVRDIMLSKLNRSDAIRNQLINQGLAAYRPNTAEAAAAGAATMMVDAPAFMAGGIFGNLLTKGVASVGGKLLSKSAMKGLAMVNNNFFSWGGYGAASGYAGQVKENIYQGAEAGDEDYFSNAFKNASLKTALVEGAKEGVKGVAIGAMGVGVQYATRNAGRTARIATDIGMVPLEAGAFVTMDVMGAENPMTAEEIMHDYGQQVMMIGILHGKGVLMSGGKQYTKDHYDEKGRLVEGAYTADGRVKRNFALEMFSDEDLEMLKKGRYGSMFAEVKTAKDMLDIVDEVRVGDYGYDRVMWEGIVEDEAYPYMLRAKMAAAHGKMIAMPRPTQSQIIDESAKGEGFWLTTYTSDGKAVESKHFKTLGEAKKAEKMIAGQLEDQSVMELQDVASCADYTTNEVLKQLVNGDPVRGQRLNEAMMRMQDGTATAEDMQTISVVKGIIEDAKKNRRETVLSGAAAEVYESVGIDPREALKKLPDNRTEEDKAAINIYKEKIGEHMAQETMSSEEFAVYMDTDSESGTVKTGVTADGRSVIVKGNGDALLAKDAETGEVKMVDAKEVTIVSEKTPAETLEERRMAIAETERQIAEAGTSEEAHGTVAEEPAAETELEPGALAEAGRKVSFYPADADVDAEAMEATYLGPDYANPGKHKVQGTDGKVHSVYAEDIVMPKAEDPAAIAEEPSTVVTEPVAEGAQPSTVVETEQPGAGMPLNAKGKPDPVGNGVTPERALQYFEQERGMEPDVVKEMVNGQVQKAADDIQKYAKKRPDPAKMDADDYMDAFEQWKQGGMALREVENRWKAIADAIAQREFAAQEEARRQAEAIRAEEEARLAEERQKAIEETKRREQAHREFMEALERKKQETELAEQQAAEEMTEAELAEQAVAEEKLKRENQAISKRLEAVSRVVDLDQPFDETMAAQVAFLSGKGGGMKITPESLRLELGSNFGKFGQEGKLGMVASKEKGGRSIAEIADAIVDAAGMVDGQPRLDANIVRSELINCIMEGKMATMEALERRVGIGMERPEDRPEYWTPEKVAEYEEAQMDDAFGGPTKVADKVAEASAEVNTNPTEAQKEAGNYKKGHVRVDGMEISIEQPKGSVRSGMDADGKEWSTEMQNTYGYIRGTVGKDKDHIDIFLSDNPEEGNVYVVDQVNPKTGEFDEHKVMYGFKSLEEAREAYLSNYEEGWKGLGNITEVNKATFKVWLQSSKMKTKPFADYKLVTAENARTERNTLPDELRTLDEVPFHAAEGDASAGIVDVEKATEVAKSLGLHVSLMQQDPVDGADAMIDSNGLVKVNFNSPKGAGWLISHESGHRMERLAPEAYKVYKEAALGMMTPEEVQARIEAKRKAYRSMGLEKSDEQLRGEIVNDMMGDIFAEPGKIDELIRKSNPTVWRGIMNAIEDMWAILTGKSKENAYQVYKKLRDALRESRAAYKKEMSDTLERIETKLARLNHSEAVFESSISKDGNLSSGGSHVDDGTRFSSGAQKDGAKIRKDFVNRKDLTEKMAGFIKKMSESDEITTANWHNKLMNELGFETYEGQNSQYFSFMTPDGRLVSVRMSGHPTQARNYKKQAGDEHYSIVVQVENWDGRDHMKTSDKIRLHEYHYAFPDKERLVDITKSLFGLVDEGKYADFAWADTQGESPRQGGEPFMFAQISDENYKQIIRQIANSELHVDEKAAAISRMQQLRMKGEEMVEKTLSADQLHGAEFSIREKEEPKKKGIGYKVFYRNPKDGKLYPPMVANPGGADTPVGVWLDADAAPIVGQTKTGRNQVKAGGKGTQGGSGQLAYRPGWHLGEIPYALQFGRLNPETDPWIITGAMKVNRVLSNEEVDDLVRKAGREPQRREGQPASNAAGTVADTSTNFGLTGKQQMAVNGVAMTNHYDEDTVMLNDENFAEAIYDMNSRYVSNINMAKQDALYMLTGKNAVGSWEAVGSRDFDLYHIDPEEIIYKEGMLEVRGKDLLKEQWKEMKEPLEEQKAFFERMQERTDVPWIKAELNKMAYSVQNRMDRLRAYAEKSEAGKTGRWAADGTGGEVRNRDYESEVFYSNAQKAVEGIKQEKATAEQWLKMIQNGGGLKAGEDKWLGLSDWLKDKQAKGEKLTKQEILDYIRRNRIEIEEVNYSEDARYSEDDWRERVNESDAFAMLRDELVEYDENENPYIDRKRFDQMAREIPGFREAFSIDYWGEDIDIDDPLAAAVYLKLKGSEKPIDDIRLNYTTEGLTNKKEIALTIPEIKPYNESDDIHFGDAGNGRAVVWVRFGDAESTTPFSAENFEAMVKAHEDAKAATAKYEQELYDKYGIERDDSMESFEKFVLAMTPEENAEWNRLSQMEEEAYKEANPTKREKVLVIDEIQSKRHQDGREHGYTPFSRHELAQMRKEAFDALYGYMDELREKYNISKYDNSFNKVSDEERAKLVELRDRYDQATEDLNDAVPDAPFEKNWSELAMKRMLRYAAENGYDKVAWTKGAQQARRYDISGVVDKIRVYTDAHPAAGDEAAVKSVNFMINDSDKQLLVNRNGIIVNNTIIGNSQLQGKPLAEVFGKDIADEIMGKPAGNTTIELGGREIGGEGMKGFYDTMLPSFMNKYGKKWGVKVGEVELDDVEDAARTMWSVDVTPEMKESVMQGQPMFRRTWHGSGADFEEFDHKFMGSGEGSQVYGWGTYVSEVDGIAKSYADIATAKKQQSSAPIVKWKGHEIDFSDANPLRMAFDLVEDSRTIAEARARAVRYKDMAEEPEMQQKWQGALDILKQSTKADFKRASVKGNRKLYEVEIPDDNGENYLSWNEPLSARQRKTIADALYNECLKQEPEAFETENEKKMLRQQIEQEFADAELNGGKAYGNVIAFLGSGQKGASKLLSEAGFVGVKVPTNNLREGDKSKNNYVIFDERNAKIVNKTLFKMDERTFGLGEERNSKGIRFYQDETGEKDLANIGQEVFDAMGIESKPFRMTEDMAHHVYSRHGKELGLTDETEAVNYVVGVMNSFDHVRKGNEPGTYIFSVENGQDKVGDRAITIVVDNNEDGYIGIKTSGKERIDGLRKKEILWEKSEPSATDTAPVNVATNSARKNGLADGNASNQSNVSERKGSEKMPDGKINRAEITETAEKTAGNLGKKIHVCQNAEEIKDPEVRASIKKAEAEGRTPTRKGWFNTRTGEIEVYAPAAADVEDVKKTVLHETVGHYGLRELLSDNEHEYQRAMTEMYRLLNAEQKKQVTDSMQRRGWDVATAMDEFLADIAMQEHVPGWWQKAKSIVKNLLRKIGIDVELSDGDLKYMLWASREALRNSREVVHEDGSKSRVYDRKGIDQRAADWAMRWHNDVLGLRSKWEAERNKDKGKVKNTDAREEQVKNRGWEADEAREEERRRTQEKSQAFKAWFGDWEKDPENASKVVDAEGRPLVVYHGTQLMEWYFKDGHPYTRYTERFNTFNDGKGFFTSDREAAESFARGKHGMYATYLDIKKPFVIDCQGKDWDAIEGYENKDGYKRVSTDYIVNDIKNNHPEYDGVIFKNVMNENHGNVDRPIDDYVPFKAEQIKSAVDNNGEFSRTNKDIRFRDDDDPDDPTTPGGGGSTPTDGGRKRSLEETLAMDAQKFDAELSKMQAEDNAGALAADLRAFVRNRMNALTGERIGANAINSIIAQLDAAKKAKNLEPVLRQIKRIISEAELKAEIDNMMKVLNTKTQSKTTKGIIKGVLVDSMTNRVIEDIRGSYKQMITTTVDAQIKDVNDRIRELKAEYGIKRIDEGNDEFKAKYRVLADELSRLREERKDAENKNAKEDYDRLTAREEEITNLINKCAEEGREIPDEYIQERIALPIRKQLAELRTCMGNMDECGEEIDKLRMSLPGKKGEERKRIMEDIERLNTEYNVWQRRITFDSRRISEELKDIISEGRSKRGQKVMDDIENQRKIIKTFCDAVRKNKVLGQNEGKAHTGSRKKDDMIESWKSAGESMQRLAQDINSPMYSFNYLLKYIDRNHHQGEGPLYEMLMKGEHGAVMAVDRYTEGVKEFNKTVKEKIEKEIWKGKKLEDVIYDSQNWLDGPVHIRMMEDTNGAERGDMIPKELKKGQALYVWLTWRQGQGRVKLENMGYTQDTINEIEEMLGQQYLDFGRWVTDEYFPQLRAERYNPTYERVYGTDMHMASHYFPLRIWEKAVYTKGDLGEKHPDLPSATNARIVSRTENRLPVSTETNAFDVLYSYGEQMENFNAFAELARDLNYIYHSKGAENLVEANDKGMWKHLVNSFNVVTMSYRDGDTKPIERILGGVQNSFMKNAIGFRWYTAAKQTLSYPAFMAYSDDPLFQAELVANIARAFTSDRFMPGIMQNNYAWAMEHLPAFRARVEDGSMGIEGLNEDGLLGKFGKKWSKWGMAANKLVDACTVAAGSRAVYNCAYRKAKKDGKSEAEATRIATVEAEICFNESQQSSRPEFSSAIQKNRDLLSRGTVAFQNSNIGYRRALMEGVYDIVRAREIRDIAIRNGESKEEADKSMWRAMWRGIRKVSVFGALLPGLWWMGSNPSMFAQQNDDDKEKDNLWVNGLANIMMGMLTNGTMFGPYAQSMYGTVMRILDGKYGASNDYSPIQAFDLFSEIATDAAREYMKNGTTAMGGAIGRWAARMVGINPETFVNIELGIEDAVRNGGLTAEDVMFILNMPNSQRTAIVERKSRDKSLADYLNKVLHSEKSFGRDDLHQMLPSTKETTEKRINEIVKQYVKVQVPGHAEAVKELVEPIKAVKERYNEIKGIKSFSMRESKDGYAADLLTLSRAIDETFKDDKTMRNKLAAYLLTPADHDDVNGKNGTTWKKSVMSAAKDERLEKELKEAIKANDGSKESAKRIDEKAKELITLRKSVYYMLTRNDQNEE